MITEYISSCESLQDAKFTEKYARACAGLPDVVADRAEEMMQRRFECTGGGAVATADSSEETCDTAITTLVASCETVTDKKLMKAVVQACKSHRRIWARRAKEVAQKRLRCVMDEKCDATITEYISSCESLQDAKFTEKY